MGAQEEYVTATEATHLLDVSKVKMAKLLRSGEIPHIPDPRNERAKLIKRSDIDAWVAKAPRPKALITDGSNRTRPTVSNLHEQLVTMT